MNIHFNSVYLGSKLDDLRQVKKLNLYEAFFLIFKLVLYRVAAKLQRGNSGHGQLRADASFLI